VLGLAPRFPDLHVVAVGAPAPGPEPEAYAADLFARVRDSGFADRFHFIGFREDVAVLLSAFDVVAVPSWTESFGRTAVEGMAAGCGVVATNAGGLAELVEDNVNGLVVEPHAPAQLEAALFRLISEPQLRRRLAAAGRQTARRFSVDAHVQAVEALYDEILDERAAAPRRLDRAA
jgi:glycosyltransferase involved in cell wall biosynthesis